MTVLSKVDIAALSPRERLALINDLWDSLEEPALEPDVEAAHRKILEERLESYDPSSEKLLTLDQVCERLHAK